jgi:futalosine hydrolase
MVAKREKIRILAMHILLCAATEPEISPTLHWLDKYQKCHVKHIITGVGLLPSAYSLTKAVMTSRYDLIVQAGIAGSLQNNLSLGDVISVSSECLGDAGVVEHNKFYSLFDMKLTDPNSFPWKQGKLINPNSLLLDINLPSVQSVSVNEISTDRSRIAYYSNVLGAEIESMEGAALHYICLQEQIPFLQLRSISNFAGERDKSQWKMQTAIEKLNEQLQHIFANLTIQ